MRIYLSVLMGILSVHLMAQPVNEEITLQLSQQSILRVDAGSDINLSEAGSAVIGESVNIIGGSPEFTHEWNDESGIIYYEKTPEVYNPGKYWLTVADVNNCSAVDSITVFNYGTSVIPFSRDDSVQVVMYPGSNIIHVEVRNVDGPVVLSIISLDGKLLYSYSESGVSGNFRHQADLSHFEGRSCLVSVQYNRQISARKLILNKTLGR